MPQDAYTIKYVVKELKELFCGGKISKINMPERDELSFIIYTKNRSVKLEISASPKFYRISVGRIDKPNPKNPPNFCMLLRKHLQNAEITDVGQIGFERIVFFDLTCFSEFTVTQMRLYCELMGKYSNLILTQDGNIVGALKTAALEENARRVLFTGAKYVLPESQGKADPTDVKRLEDAFKYAEGDRAEFISRAIAGIAASTAREMTAFYGADISAAQVYEYVNGGVLSPCVTYYEGRPYDFKTRSSEKDKKTFGTLLEAQTEFYSCAYEKKRFDEKKKKLAGALSASIKKTEKRLAQIEQKLFECRSAEDIRRKAELITANIYAVERGAAFLEADNYYEEDCPKIKIELDRQLTPSQNAQKYYKKYAKLKRTAENLAAQRGGAQETLSYLKSIESSICAAETLYDFTETEEELTALGLLKSDCEKKKKVAQTAPYRIYGTQGFKILVGRNNIQNDRLTKRLSQEDIWLHTQKYHSSHAAVIADGRQIPEEVILTAAELCAYYSEARERDKVPVDFTKKKYVKKPPKSNLGFVIYTDHNTLLVKPNPHPELKSGEDME